MYRLHRLRPVKRTLCIGAHGVGRTRRIGPPHRMHRCTFCIGCTTSWANPASMVQHGMSEHCEERSP